jgi:hypothetical protein
LVAISLTAFSLLMVTSPASRGTTNADPGALGQSQAVTAAEAIETYATDNGGSYRGATARRLRMIEPALNDARLYVHAGSDSYLISVRTPTPPYTHFRLRKRAGGIVERSCLPRGRGACSTNGAWVPPSTPPTPASIDSEAKSGVVNAAEAMETCATDNNGVYDQYNCTAANLTLIEPTLNDLGARLEVAPTGAGYTVSVISNRNAGSVSFTLRRLSNGVTTRTCTVGSGVERGGCTAGNTW